MIGFASVRIPHTFVFAPRTVCHTAKFGSWFTTYTLSNVNRQSNTLGGIGPLLTADWSATNLFDAASTFKDHSACITEVTAASWNSSALASNTNLVPDARIVEQSFQSTTYLSDVGDQGGLGLLGVISGYNVYQ
jgi:hypothetical protein